MSVRIISSVLLLVLPFLFLGCNQDPTSPDYPQIVIDTFVPAFNENDTYLTLIDDGGNIIAEDDDGNPDQTNHKSCSRIDYQGGLSSGRYYIKVHKPTAAGNPNYGIQVHTYDPGSSFPAIVAANEDETVPVDDTVDVNGVPTAPWTILLGPGQEVSRSIFPDATDVDWYQLDLP